MDNFGKKLLGILLVSSIYISFSGTAFAQVSSPLFVGPGDVRIEPENGEGFTGGGGFHLYVRKKAGMNSVLLTETTRDPAGVASNYAFRAQEWNPINGDERRRLNGVFLESAYARYSLVDSTPEPDEQFGEAFHIYLPRVLVYGYPWARSGTVEINRWTFINIRTFALPYADYDEGFLDNPFMFDLRERPAPPPETDVEEKKDEAGAAETETTSEPPEIAKAPDEETGPELRKEEPILTDDYNPEAGREFNDISDDLIFSKGPGTIVDDIMDSLGKISPQRGSDIVFVVDSTGSMKDDVAMLRKKWIPILEEWTKINDDVRLGLVLYRDYGEAGYNFNGLPVKVFDFTREVKTFEKNLNSFTIRGNEGGDIPEAVYEGLFAGLDFFAWRDGVQKKIILIGDAEPHPVPRGTKLYTKELVVLTAKEKEIGIDAIIVPDNKKDRGR